MKNTTMQHLHKNLAKVLFDTLYYDFDERTFSQFKDNFKQALIGYGLDQPIIDSYWDELIQQNSDKDRVVTFKVNVRARSEQHSVAITALNAGYTRHRTWCKLSEEDKIDRLLEYLEHNRIPTITQLVEIDGVRV